MQTQTSYESYTATTKREQLWKALENPAFRRAYSEDVGTGLAFQIRALREHRGWTQHVLAQATGKKQETVSQLENPNYGSYTLKTLNRLAAAFDVGLQVRFAPFSELVDWAVQLSPSRIAPPSFTEEHETPTVLASNTQVAAIGSITADTILVAGLIDDETERQLVAGVDAHEPMAGDNQYALAA